MADNEEEYSMIEKMRAENFIIEEIEQNRVGFIQQLWFSPMLENRSSTGSRKSATPLRHN